MRRDMTCMGYRVWARVDSPLFGHVPCRRTRGTGDEGNYITPTSTVWLPWQYSAPSEYLEFG